MWIVCTVLASGMDVIESCWTCWDILIHCSCPVWIRCSTCSLIRCNTVMILVYAIWHTYSCSFVIFVVDHTFCLSFFIQTDGSVPNTLVIANCEVVKPRVAAAEHIAQVMSPRHVNICYLIPCSIFFKLSSYFLVLALGFFSSTRKHDHPLWRSSKQLYIQGRYLILSTWSVLAVSWILNLLGADQRSGVLYIYGLIFDLSKANHLHERWYWLIFQLLSNANNLHKKLLIEVKPTACLSGKEVFL